MVQINLLPPVLKKKKEKQVLERQMLPVVFFLAGVAIFLTLIWLLLFWRMGAGRAHLDALNKQWHKIEKDVKQLNALKADKNNLEKRATFINQMVGREVHWAEFLNRLSDALPDGVWFTNVSIKTKKEAYKELKITGQAISLGKEEMVESIERFVNNLKRTDIFSKNFKDIKLGALKRIKIGEWDTMRFELTCKMF